LTLGELLLDGGEIVAGGDPAGDGLLLFGRELHAGLKGEVEMLKTQDR